MRCTDVMKKSTAYLGGELDPDSGSALRGHLRTCQTCRAELEVESQVRDGLRAFGAEMDPPPALWNRIQGRLAEHEIADAGRGAWARWWKIALGHAPVVGGVCAAALALWMLWPAANAEETATVAVSEAGRGRVLPSADDAALSLEAAREQERSAARTGYALARADVAALGGVIAATPLAQASPVGGTFVLERELAALTAERERLERETRALFEQEWR